MPTAYGSESLQVLAQVWLSLSKPRCVSCRPVDPSSSEIWAAGVVGEKNATLVRDVLALLTAEEQDDIMALCGRCLYHTLQTCVRVHGIGESTFVGEYAAGACSGFFFSVAAPSELTAPDDRRQLTAGAATGDIDDMWLRDSSVQMAIYLPRIEQHPALRRIIEGAIRLQAYYITQVNVQATYFRSLHRNARLSRCSEFRCCR